MNPLTPYLLYVKAGLAAALLAAAFVGGCNHGKRAGAEEVRALKLAQAQDAAKSAAALAEATDKARATERAQAESFAAIAAQHLRDQADAKDRQDRLLADARAGTVRLRHELAQAGCPVPGAAADSAELAGSAERGAAIAIAAVGVGADCDAQVAGLQAILRAEREVR